MDQKPTQGMTRGELLEHVRELEAKAAREVELQTVVEDLRVHQAELAAQARELADSQTSLEETRDRYVDLYDNAPLGYITLDYSGTIRAINLTGGTLLERQPGQVLGQFLTRFVVKGDRATLRDHLRRCRQGDCQVVSQVTLLTGQGRQIPVQLTSQRVAGPGQPTFRTAITDLTLRHQQEMAMLQLNRTLEKRTEQLRDLAAELTHAEQRERKRLAQILHDHLQQLLVAAKLRLTVIEDRCTDTTVRPLINSVDSLIAQAIQASRSLTFELAPPVLYDGGLVPALDWLSRTMRNSYSIAVHLQCDPVDPMDETVRVFLFQATRELLFNAVKHAKINEMWVRVLAGGEDPVRVIVEDHGVGFDPRAALERAAVTRGFGLFSIKQRISVLGGCFELDTSPGKGTRITLIAPATLGRPAPLPLPGPALEIYPRSLPPTHDPSARKIRVLLADDHKLLRDGLASLLQHVPDVEVVGQASDGLMAVELTQELQPDVVIMDVTMPRLTGIEATQRIHRQWPHIQVIGLSMHENADMAQAMRRAGAADYLTKGGPADELIGAIRKLHVPGV